MNAISFFRKGSPLHETAVAQYPRRDPLNRLLAQLTALAGPESRVVQASSRPWSSATFVGAQHQVTVLLPSAVATGRFVESLPEAEFRIPGHIVADAVLDERALDLEAGTDHWLCRITALTIEDH